MEQDRRVTVEEASKILGISKDAVRKRINRNTIQAEKVDGEWLVSLDGGGTTSQQQDDSHYWGLIQQQQQEIDRLRAELERKDTIIDRLIERIPPALTTAPDDQRPPWWQFWRRGQ